jgi:hypothetical protein
LNDSIDSNFVVIGALEEVSSENTFGYAQIFT